MRRQPSLKPSHQHKTLRDSRRKGKRRQETGGVRCGGVWRVCQQIAFCDRQIHNNPHRIIENSDASLRVFILNCLMSQGQILIRSLILGAI
jgi:hypothetical protein